MDYRKADPELYIADRANNRVMVYDLEGNFKRKFGEDWLITPCTFAVAGDLLAIPELQARVTLVDPDDNLAGQLGDNTSVAQREGWPNVHGHDGNLERPPTSNPASSTAPMASRPTRRATSTCRSGSSAAASLSSSGTDRPAVPRGVRL